MKRFPREGCKFVMGTCLVSNVGDIFIVKIVETFDEGFGSAVEGDERGLIARDIAMVFYVSTFAKFDITVFEGGLITYNPYSQRLLSNVSIPAFCRLHTLLGFGSIVEHHSGF